MTRSRTTLVRATAFAAVAASFGWAAPRTTGAQSRSDRSDRERGDAGYRIDTTVSVGRDASIELGLISGNIVVTGSSRDEVRVHAYSEGIPLRFEHIGNNVRVMIVSGQYRRSGDQRIEISVPLGARVTATSVSGDVEVRGVRGEVEAGSTSGDVSVDDVTRRANVHTVSGSVRARNVNADIRARSVSGDVTLERIVGEIDASSTSGEIELLDARSSRVHAESVSGDITYDGTIASDGRYDFSAHSGSVHLTIPGDSGVSMSVSSFSGSVNTAFQTTLSSSDLNRSDRGRSRRRMELSINGGGARMTVETFSGDITIDRASASRRDRRDRE